MGFAFLEHEGPIAFAHRGGAASGLENSMAAFSRAVGLGYRYLETDVHVTSDGVALAFHDDTLDRVTDRRGRVSRLPWSLVSQARIGGVEPIPRLEDLLAAWPEVRINLDVKELAAVASLTRAITRTGALDRVCVAAFSRRRVAAVRRELGPRLCTALSTAGVARLLTVAATPLPRAPSVAPAAIPCVQVPVRVGPLRVLTPGLVRLAHQRSQRVHAWTIDDPVVMGRLLDHGVDGIMTDQLITLREVMRARGHWPE